MYLRYRRTSTPLNKQCILKSIEFDAVDNNESWLDDKPSRLKNVAQKIKACVTIETWCRTKTAAGKVDQILTTSYDRCFIYNTQLFIEVISTSAQLMQGKEF